jgi:hypothetical protein
LASKAPRGKFISPIAHDSLQRRLSCPELLSLPTQQVNPDVEFSSRIASALNGFPWKPEVKVTIAGRPDEALPPINEINADMDF